MASGKQTSFQFGEVSPSLRFRSDAVSYSSGLSKLKNMYVRRAGGVSNRAGTTIVYTLEEKFLKPDGLEYYTPEEILDVKYFSFYSPTGGLNTISCIQTASGNRLYFNDFLVDEVSFQNVTTSTLINAPSPEAIKFTYTKDGVFITPSCSFEGNDPAIDSGNIMVDFQGKAILFHKDPQLNAEGTSTVKAVGIPPFLPASYLVTAILKDGTEVKVTSQSNIGYDPSTWDENDLTGKIVYPSSSVSAYLKIEFTSTYLSRLAQVKFFNIYRSAGTSETNNFYKLAAKIPYDGSSLIVSTSDYGADFAAETPPLDNSIYGQTFLDSAINSVYYQQRLIMSFSPYSQNIKPGEAAASKIGAPKQMIAPLIFNEIGAFTFSVPIQDGSPIVGWLSMDRLIVLTLKGTYVIRGGEQGALTPTTINPLRISLEGCDPLVQPKMSGRRGYFINSRKTKLMAIQFGDDGNLNVFEASLFSDHLIDENIKELEVVGGIEDTVYLLTDSGKIVRVTCTDDGIHGFSRVETQGEIKHIFKFGDVLRAVVHRNGVKIVEQFEDRYDKIRDREIFSDSSVRFGFTLSKLPDGRYTRLEHVTPVFPLGFDILANIEVPSSGVWTEGEVIKIRTNGPVLLGHSQEFQFHFFYDDAQGNTQTLRFVPNFSSEVTTGDPTWTHEHSGYFLSTVPESLRDVKNQSISDKEKLSRHSRFAPAINKLENLFSIETMYEVLGGQEEQYPLSVVGDGEVISSPNSLNLPILYIEKVGADTTLNLQDYFSYGYFGIPYDCEFETLDLETSGERTVTDAKKLINAVGLGLMETRGGFAGIPEQTLENMTSIVTREDESFNNQTKNFNGHIVVHIPTEWNEPGRVTIKHVDPSPISILSVYPKGIAGD